MFDYLLFLKAFAILMALHVKKIFILFKKYVIILGTAVAQWLRCGATNRKVAGSIPAGVIGILH